MAISEKIAIDLHRRVNLALLVAGIFFGLIILRLWYIQVLQGSYYREKSENNRLRTIYSRPPRGNILDRNGVVLVRSRPAFNIELVVEDAHDPKLTLRRLAKVLEMNADELLAKLAAPAVKRTRFQPRIILQDVDRDVVAKVAAKRFTMPGLVITVEPARSYLYNNFASHTIGHIREINSDQLASANYSGYLAGDLVGQSGVEKAHENMLRGERGVRKVIVNARGVRIADASSVQEKPGHNLTLSIDYALQATADLALKDQVGVAVVMRVDTGEILALSSAPNFDPNIFVGSLDPEDWKKVSDPNFRPMSNRAIQGSYAPGSVFKVVTAAAALAEGVSQVDEEIFCGGSYRIGKSHPFHCHKREGHGKVNIVSSLKQSCNVYYYVVGQRLGVDRIHDYALKMGFGKKTGLDLGAEVQGLVPSTAWKRAYFSKPEDQQWYPGETPSVSIGQGAVSVSPIQVVQSFAGIANGGDLIKPTVVRSIKSNTGLFFDDSYLNTDRQSMGISPEILETIRQGLIAVVNEKGGTGGNSRIDEAFGVQAGGKTGTAQQLSSKHKGQKEDNAWFAGFAPADRPEIAVVVLVEGAGKGGVVAAPIAKKLMEIYFGVSRQKAAGSI